MLPGSIVSCICSRDSAKNFMHINKIYVTFCHKSTNFEWIRINEEPCKHAIGHTMHIFVNIFDRIRFCFWVNDGRKVLFQNPVVFLCSEWSSYWFVPLWSNKHFKGLIALAKPQAVTQPLMLCMRENDVVNLFFPT